MYRHSIYPKFFDDSAQVLRGNKEESEQYMRNQDVSELLKFTESIGDDSEEYNLKSLLKEWRDGWVELSRKRKA